MVYFQLRPCGRVSSVICHCTEDRKYQHNFLGWALARMVQYSHKIKYLPIPCLA